MKAPGPLLASGRDADIFEYGPGLVLRRSRRRSSMVTEARVMDYAHSLGYPVPAIDEVSDDGLSLTMERIDGLSMVAVMSKRPWTVRHNADVLADLHRRLHEIDGPSWLPAAFGAEGSQLLHLDLHPLNVMMSANGPIVIDWAGAARGHPATDVALTWILNASGALPTGRVKAAVLGRGRALFVNRFLHHFDLATITSHLRAVVEWKVRDPNMSAKEQATMRRLAETAG